MNKNRKPNPSGSNVNPAVLASNTLTEPVPGTVYTWKQCRTTKEYELGHIASAFSGVALDNLLDKRTLMEVINRTLNWLIAKASVVVAESAYHFVTIAGEILKIPHRRLKELAEASA